MSISQFTGRNCLLPPAPAPGRPAFPSGPRLHLSREELEQHTRAAQSARTSSLHISCVQLGERSTGWPWGGGLHGLHTRILGPWVSEE